MDRVTRWATTLLMALAPFLLLVYFLARVDTPGPAWFAVVIIGVADRIFGAIGSVPPLASWAIVGFLVGGFTYLSAWELREVNRPYLRVGLLIAPWLVVLSFPGAWLMLDIHVSRPSVIHRADETLQAGDVRPFQRIEFAWIPAGQFRMGSPTTEPDRRADETEHMVTISHGFWMGRYEVTRAQWYSVMKNPPADYNEETEGDMPMGGVTWAECEAFVAELNRGREAGFSMPTEAEWEYACRAGGMDAYSCGSDSACLAGHAWYAGNSKGKAHPVGQAAPNAWGLYDMHGNVWEWCQDFYGEYPQRRVVDPTGPRTGQYTILRGGSWFSPSEECRAARRFVFVPGYFTDRSIIGFRLARTRMPAPANPQQQAPGQTPRTDRTDRTSSRPGGVPATP
jgi:formylglycine-generating enzyme required for sulfatase activity